MDTVLVTGATGNVGAKVVAELRRRGLPVRAFVRDAAKAAALFGDGDGNGNGNGGGVELVVGDFADAASVRRAVAGVDGVFLACSNLPQQVAYETGVIDAAREAGVRRLVKLSALGAEVGSPVAFWDWHGRIEQHLWASEVPAVALRPTFGMGNLLGWADQITETERLFVPAAGARIAMIDPQDVAAVAAAALTEATHDGQTYTLTGPEPITFDRVAAELSAAAGRDFQFVAVPDEAALQALIGRGVPEFAAAQVVTILGFLRRGAQDRTTDTVRAVTGREPRAFAAFAADHAPLFAG